MKFLKYCYFTLCIFSLYSPLWAQVPTEDQSINEGSIGDQFEYAIKKSNNYNSPTGQSYEVIKNSMILNLKTNTLDSLSAIQSNLDKATSTIDSQQKEISTLKTNLAKTQGTLDATNKQKDSMEFLGMQMSKTGYNVLMWSIVAGLFGWLLFFIFKFKHSNEVTKTTKTSFTELEEEFKEHRRTALEREQKVKRELQDLINKFGT